MRARILGLGGGLLLWAAACEKAAPLAEGSAPSAASVAASTRAQFESEPRAPGTLAGLVLYAGAPAARTPINTQAQGGCGLDPEQPPLTETLIVDAGRVANVFVWLENPPADAARDAIPSEALELRQRGCIYRPHALGLRAGQLLRITNEDGATHNVRTLSRHNAEADFNRTQAAGAPAIEARFTAHEVAIAVVCDLHPWMKAWIGVFEHPYFAVSGADGGFAWSGLPPGEYRVKAWHEKLGRLSGSATLSPERGAGLCLSFDALD